MMRPAGLFIAALAGLSAAAPAGTATAEAPGDIVWCHDEGRSLIARTARWRCKGTVVSEEEARKIRDSRRRRINRSFEPRRTAPAPDVKQTGTGTGFYVSNTGHVVTNQHVIDGCKAISVTPAGARKPIKALLLADDPALDLALLQSVLPGKGFAKFRDDRIRPGDDVAVIGYPLHGRVAIKPVLVRGHVSVGAGAPRPSMFAMKIDVRRGNSGGPILDSSGRIAGVVVAKVNSPGVYASTGKLITDLGFGIRLPVAMDFLRKHKIPIAMEKAGDQLDENQLMATAETFVAQIGCWR